VLALAGTLVPASRKASWKRSDRTNNHINDKFQNGVETMLTRDEKELLEALKEQLDDEQKAALDEAPEEEIKEFLKEARKEIEKEMNKHGGGGTSPGKGIWARIRDLSFSDFMNEYGQGSPLSAVFLFLILKTTRSRTGCGILAAIAIAAIIAIAIAVARA
jgi:thiamine pyrophosphate-dependent acetolactate synthase large subunit-like protein